MNIQEKQEFRNKLFHDVYNNIIPKRVPILEAMTFGFHVENAGEDFLKIQYELTPEKLQAIFDKTMEFAKGDQIGFGAQKSAVSLFLSKSNVYNIAANGMIQHPEVCMMHDDEYDEFSKDPYAFMVDTIRKRSFGMADAQDPVMYLISFMKNYFAEQDANKMLAAANRANADKYGLFKAPAGVNGTLPVPFDVLADTQRGFSQIVKDIKRCPEKVLAACEALMPYSIWVGNRSKADSIGANGIPTHMGPFMRTKEFEKFYWPTFEKTIHIQAKRGKATQIFCENNWERFLDYLQELPMGTRFFMEYGDPKLFKEKLGKKMALGGFYPLSMLRTATKQQCVDKMKELMDIMMPGGNYFFRFDKTALRGSDINIENYTAIMDYLLEHGVYDNAGCEVSSVKKEDTIKSYDASDYPAFSSKYFVSFEEWVKDYNVPDPSVLPALRKSYEKYSQMAYSLLA